MVLGNDIVLHKTGSTYQILVDENEFAKRLHKLIEM